MPNLIRASMLGLVSIVVGGWSAGALAEEGVLESPASTRMKATPELRPSPLGSRPVDAAALASGRGGTQVVSDMKLNGTVADNQASNLTTGSNLISEGSFSGAAGLPMVIQNSGNNVLIQNATIVNVQVQ